MDRADLASSASSQSLPVQPPVREDSTGLRKRYFCEWPGCEKRFNRPSSLKIHAVTHTGARPFPCTVSGCSSSFNVKSNMIRHTRTRHQENQQYRDHEDEDYEEYYSDASNGSSRPPSSSSSRRPSASSSRRPSFSLQQRPSFSARQPLSPPQLQSLTLENTYPSSLQEEHDDLAYTNPSQYAVRHEPSDGSPLASPSENVHRFLGGQGTIQRNQTLGSGERFIESSPPIPLVALNNHSEGKSMLNIIESMAKSRSWGDTTMSGLNWSSQEDQSQDSQQSGLSLVPYPSSPSSPLHTDALPFHAPIVETSTSDESPVIYTEAFDKKSVRCLDGRITRQSKHAVAFGGFADVCDGYLGTQKVAIKIIRPFSSSGTWIEERRLLRRLRREYLTWSSLYHPNVLECLGFSYDFSREPQVLPSLISPWMSNGSVLLYLTRYPNRDRLEILLGIAQGLSYLHDRQVIHGDLRAGNILMSSSGVPCLSDFGLSQSFQVEEMTTTSELAGSLRWMSPELLVDHVVANSSTDVWAYGMTVLEILSGQPPYHDIKKDPVVLDKLKNKQLPTRPDGCTTLTDPMWGLCQQCWIADPVHRLSMRAVISEFIDFQRPN